MTILQYKNCCRDTGVMPPNVYIDDGQGCGTVWFWRAKDAETALAANGGVAPSGWRAGFCKECACSYPYGSAESKQYPEWACRAWKQAWTDDPAHGPKSKEETQ